MPTHFGTTTGPRQGPDGRPFDWRDNPLRTTASVCFLSEQEPLARLLPPEFVLAGLPVVTVEWTALEHLAWLAGRGYNMLGVKFLARFRGAQDDVTGEFLSVLWENLADPIISGREELGFNKRYAELPAPERSATAFSATASWLGHHFFELQLQDLVPVADPTPLLPGQPASAGLLHLKHMPRTGAWGETDTHHAALTPSANSHYRRQARWEGRGRCAFITSSWAQLPTLSHIVNPLAALPVCEWLGASLEQGVGGKDLSDQRALG
jgi:hypothetical protein